jgi:hypothetical protein
MPNPSLNPDGTVQVAPPTQSAFGPASVSAPPPPAAQPPQRPTQVDPGFAGAILTLLKGLVSTLAPGQLLHRDVDVDAQVNKATADQKDPHSLGNQL